MEKHNYPGKFIVFEGLDGSGKSSLAEDLASYLEAVLTHEPTEESEEGKLIRRALKKEIKFEKEEFQALYSKDREQHLDNLIIPSLKERKHVITERYFFSTLAYGVTAGVEYEKLYEMNEDFILPDIVFFVNTSPEECMRRIEKRGIFDYFEKLDFLQETYKNYHKILKDFQNVFFIDSEKPIKESFEDIKNICKTQLNL